MRKTLLSVLLMEVVCFNTAAETWLIDTTEQWQNATQKSSELSFKKDGAVMTGNSATYQSIVKRFEKKRKVKSITFEQSSDWLNWQPVENVEPSNLRSAPVFLTKGPSDYWLFGRYANMKKNQEFKGKDIALPGYDLPLRTTAFNNEYDAPGGLKKGLGGYHAWQSRDMVNWVHHGAVSEYFSRWVTSAEYVDGKTYIYYDYPNDQDPHVYVDEDLTDGVPGKNMGMIFKDPSHGSDTAFFRDDDGSLHVFYEDWTPINASIHAWDSPLAGHAVSKNGFDDFEILPPAIDLRTTPTGKTKTYPHPHWDQHPDWDSNIGEYQEHSPMQDAFGDWCIIKIGTQYYLFGDYERASHSAASGNPVKEADANMSIARFTSDSLDKEFELIGDFGKTGHPDPDIGFAEGKFYLITQTKDFVSSGPWVDEVSARAGVDVDNDGKIDQWSHWQKVTEQYYQKKGFAKHVERIPAQLDLSELPEGYGVSFEFRTNTTENNVQPMLKKVSLTF